MSPPSSRKLPPVKAVIHAFNSVAAYRGLGVRISIVWTAILLALGVAGMFTRSPADQEAMSGDMSVLELASAAVGLIAFCSIAVNWHRFVLRDEVPAASANLRLDGLVWRYAGNSLLILMVAGFPVVLVAAVTTLMAPAATLLIVPVAVVAGTFALALSLKLPAIALGRTDFSFRDAFSAAHDNFWQLLAVFLIDLAIALVAIMVLVFAASLAANISPFLADLVGLALSMVFNIFYTLFSVSVLTSLYGYFVERRDF